MEQRVGSSKALAVSGEAVRAAGWLVAFTLAFGASQSLAQSAGSQFYDFMVMDVCVGQNDEILTDRSPIDASCTRRRNIRTDEVPPYALRNFPAGRKDCTAARTIIVKTNAPLSRHGVTRVVSSTNHLPDPDCPRSRAVEEDPDGANGPAGASIQWLDEKYGFIMGSWSHVGLSNFNGPACRSNPGSSHRFFRGWLIAPVSLPSQGGAGSGAFEAARTSSKASALMGACPARYRSALTTWRRGTVRFMAGVEMTAIVSSHYSNIDSAGLTPGDAQQVERTFWTSQLGISRWEKWARLDWVHPRNGMGAPELGKRLVNSGRCSPPAADRVQYNEALSVAPGTISGVYSEIVTANGRQQTWVMTLCEDFTNLRIGSLPPTVEEARQGADPSYWAE